MRTTGIILQARVGSSRLPGKALATIGGRTLLEHCLRRLVCAGVGRVVLATTTQSEDDALEAIARALGVAVYRGEVDDVLGRYVQAAEAFAFDVIVRATGDNPGTDIHGPGRVIAALRTNGADYACEDGLPYGAGVEAVTREALSRASREAKQVDEREHVTIYLRRNPRRFTVVTLPAPAPLRRPDIRLTVDTSDDLEHVRELFARTGSELPTLAELISVAGRPSRAKVA